MLTHNLGAAELRGRVGDLQCPLALGSLSPAVHSHELPVPEALVGVIKQPGYSGTLSRETENEEKSCIRERNAFVKLDFIYLDGFHLVSNLPALC